ncbi:hypothetical protein INR49_001360 [Caranx melampygus]|nr:hypothetical protein INR49_001360 [Caranx melampygus]
MAEVCHRLCCSFAELKVCPGGLDSCQTGLFDKSPAVNQIQEEADVDFALLFPLSPNRSRFNCGF